MASYWATNLITGNTTAAALTGTQAIRHPPVSARGTSEIHVRGTIIYASGVNLTVSDVIELAILPADHVLTGWELWSDDFDSGTTVTIKMGLMTGTVGDASRLIATVGVELLASGATTLQAPAVTYGSLVASIAGMRTVQTPSAVDRSIGMGIVVAPTNIASIRQLDFVMRYRAGQYGG